MTNLLVVIFAALLFSLFDYFGYNWSSRQKINTGIYHVFADILLALMFYGIFRLVSFPAAIASFVFYWTFGYDLLYYVWAEIIHYPRFEGKGSFWNVLENTVVTWAWWTPLGIFKYGGKKTPIPGYELAIQNGLGTGVALAICVVF